MQSLKDHEIPGRVSIASGNGGLPVIRVTTDFSEAEIYPHGAHVTSFRRKGEPPLLFMSAASDFEAGKPIRGGVPVIYPWFGGREGMPAHGTARLADWHLTETKELQDGSVRISLRLPDTGDLDIGMAVTIGTTLVMEFHLSNQGGNEAGFENCLHTYFQVSDVRNIEVIGLKGTRYLDTLTGCEHTEDNESIRFTAETDRIYQDTTATAEIRDPGLRRSIFIRKSGSLSTVVWNPWIEKSRRMPDFGDDEWPQMVCVESGNVKQNAVRLRPGEGSILRVEIESVSFP